jgi:hypothetical protein
MGGGTPPFIKNKHSFEAIAKLKKGVTLVPAFAGINSSGGPELIEKTGFPLPWG